MQRALLKIAVLLSVMGSGGYVLYKVNDALPVQTAGPTNPQEFKSIDGTNPEALDAGPSPEGITIATGPDAAERHDSRFSLPAQNEPEVGRYASIDDRATGPTPAALLFGVREDIPADARATATDGALIHASDESGSGGYDPFSGAYLADAGDAPEETALATADAQFDVRTSDVVEQVAGAAILDAFTAANPFLTGEEMTVEELSLPEQGEPAAFNGWGFSVETPEAADAPSSSDMLTAAPPVARMRPAPALTFAPELAEPAERQPTERSSERFGAGLDGAMLEPPPVDDGAAFGGASPFFEFGPATAAASEPALPADQSEPTAGYGPSAVSGFGTRDTLEAAPVDHSKARTATVGEEPNRFPGMEEASPAPKSALRTRDFAPLQPAPRVDEEYPQIIPNPSPGGLRPEFVGDATADGAATGPQQPELTIQKVAPTNATVGDPLVYAIKVKNVGNSTAHDVIVEDRIPRGTNLEGTIPQADLADRKLIWQLGHMAPGAEQTIRIKVIPTEAGDIGSVATVRFVAEVAAMTKITTPSLTMDVQGPDEVAVGEQATFRFQIANTGAGEARNVYIRNLLPAGLEHPGGRDIEYDVGALRSGETREVELAVKAVGDGSQTLVSQLNTGSTKRAETQAPVNVIASRLLIERLGPKRRFVGRPADYSTTVTNRSGASLKNVSVVEQLPEGMELASVPEGGHWDKQRRTITWRIPQLESGEQTVVRTSLIASRQNVMQWQVQAWDATGNRARLTSTLEVAGFASLAVALEHNGRPVGIGEQVALQLTVKNRGTGAASGVAAMFEIPPHLEFISADGPVDYQQDGQKVQFAALDELAADGEQTFKIVLTAREAGTTAVTAQLESAGGSQPLQYSEQVVVEGDGR